ncbi:MAG TPA: ISNCY family transposase [Bradyrhizobium sp.]|jgi:IS5 family transposase|nr:ISNCY family transposase [Xanthobacteraceae bacterium]HMH73968.1 ISNCY family transposase [Bradyrhizobium sp.]HMI12308.1 ISNCY family transposase [Bradyrhizobium sp.]
MRQERTVQATVFDIFAEHEIGRELNAMSRWLDQQRSLLSLVAADLSGHGIKETGRHGLPAEAVLRCALLKQYRQLSYVELAFHLEDSASFISFARLPLSWSPKKSVLQQTISAISAASWEAINRAVLSSARQQKLDDGSVVRIDSTVTESLMHAPTDSSLLWDGVRVMVRLLKQAETLLGATPFTWRNHRRLAKKRAAAIQYSRGKRRKAKLYRDMITATRATMASLRLAAQHLLASGSIEAVALRHEAEQYLPLIERVIDQAERRVFGGEAVPSSEKLVSIFETHTDIIVKGGRDVHYGHKLNLTTGRSGLVFDIVVEAGNPADSERFLPMLERHIARQDTAPRQTASDGGYASIANLEQAKALGVDDVVFHKKRGIAIDAMAKSRWVYRKLRNFRAGIEANISCLKRAFGLDRCTWRGLAHFQSYVWSSVVAYNLALFARLAQL